MRAVYFLVIQCVAFGYNMGFAHPSAALDGLADVCFFVAFVVIVVPAVRRAYRRRAAK